MPKKSPEQALEIDTSRDLFIQIIDKETSGENENIHSDREALKEIILNIQNRCLDAGENFDDIILKAGIFTIKLTQILEALDKETELTSVFVEAYIAYMTATGERAEGRSSTMVAAAAPEYETVSAGEESGTSDDQDSDRERSEEIEGEDERAEELGGWEVIETSLPTTQAVGGEEEGAAAVAAPVPRDATESDSEDEGEAGESGWFHVVSAPHHVPTNSSADAHDDAQVAGQDEGSTSAWVLLGGGGACM